MTEIMSPVNKMSKLWKTVWKLWKTEERQGIRKLGLKPVCYNSVTFHGQKTDQRNYDPHAAPAARGPLWILMLGRNEFALRNSPPLARLRIYGALAPPRFAGTPYYPSRAATTLAALTPEAPAWARPRVTPAPSPTAKKPGRAVSSSRDSRMRAE